VTILNIVSGLLWGPQIVGHIVHCVHPSVRPCVCHTYGLVDTELLLAAALESQKSLAVSSCMRICWGWVNWHLEGHSNCHSLLTIKGKRAYADAFGKSIYNIPWQCFCVSSWPEQLRECTRLWVQTQRQVAANPRLSQLTWALSPPIGCYHPHHHRRLLLLLSPVADIYFTVLL